MNVLKTVVRRSLKLVGFEINRMKRVHIAPQFPIEFSEKDMEIFHYVRENDLSMTSDARLIATIALCKHCVHENIQGDFVECGVWRGGNSILAAAVFDAYDASKKVYLFDTFEGMTPPEDVDVQAADGLPARYEFEKSQQSDHNDWCYSSLDEVRENFRKAGLLSDRIVFLKGDVSQSLLDHSVMPEKIAVLRLDTDWYESTKVELEQLYPRLSVGGGLIVDDYGHWAGAKKAVDEYFDRCGNRPFLYPIDYTGRIGLKCG